MKTSQAGLAFILAEEAIVLSSYRDARGVWTIGAGHTENAGGLEPGPDVSVTLAEALAMFETDIARFEAGVNRAVTVPLQQHEFDALVSFHYNTGAISTGTVDDKLNRGDRAAAMATLNQYIKGGGKTIAGLVARRAREKQLFETGEYFPRAVPVYSRWPGTPDMTAPERLPWAGRAAPLPPDLPDVHDQPSQEPSTMNSIITSLILSALRHGLTALAGVLVTYGVIEQGQSDNLVVILLGIASYVIGQSASLIKNAKKA